MKIAIWLQDDKKEALDVWFEVRAQKRGFPTYFRYELCSPHDTLLKSFLFYVNN